MCMDTNLTQNRTTRMTKRRSHVIAREKRRAKRDIQEKAEETLEPINFEEGTTITPL